MLELTLRGESSDVLAALMTFAVGSTDGELLRPVLESVSPIERAPSTVRYTVAAGIVTDHHTGLQWSQDDVSDDSLKWKAAERACADLRLGGHSDWRLPTRAELLTLVDDTRHEPCIDTGAFPRCKSAWYWTATPCAWAPSEVAWVVYFDCGYASGGNRDGSNRVRAVRGSARQ